MFLALYGPNVSDEKKFYFVGRGNLESIMLLCCQSSDGNISLNLFSSKHYLKQF